MTLNDLSSKFSPFDFAMTDVALFEVIPTLYLQIHPSHLIQNNPQPAHSG